MEGLGQKGQKRGLSLSTSYVYYYIYIYILFYLPLSLSLLCIYIYIYVHPLLLGLTSLIATSRPGPASLVPDIVSHNTVAAAVFVAAPVRWARALQLGLERTRREVDRPGKMHIEPEEMDLWKTIFLYNPVVWGSVLLGVCH